MQILGLETYKTYLAIEMSLNNAFIHGKLQRCQTRRSGMQTTAEIMLTWYLQWPLKVYCHSTQLYLKSLLITQHEVPYIITSEVKEEIGDQTENDWMSQTIAESCRLVNPFDIMLLSALTDKKCGRSWNSRDLPKWFGRTETISLPFSKYSTHFTWSSFKQNDGKLQWLKADPSRIAQTVSSPSWLWHFWLCKPR